MTAQDLVPEFRNPTNLVDLAERVKLLERRFYHLTAHMEVNGISMVSRIDAAIQAEDAERLSQKPAARPWPDGPEDYTAPSPRDREPAPFWGPATLCAILFLAAAIPLVIAGGLSLWRAVG